MWRSQEWIIDEWSFPTNNNIFFAKKKYIYNHDIGNKIIKDTKSWIFVFNERDLNMFDKSWISRMGLQEWIFSTNNNIFFVKKSIYTIMILKNKIKTNWKWICSKPNQRDKVLEFFEHVWYVVISRMDLQEWIFSTNNNIFFVTKKVYI